MQGFSVRTLLLLGTIMFAAVGAACTKSEGPSTTSTADAASASAPAMTASAAPDASPLAADTTTGDKPTAGADAEAPTMASASASASASATPSATPSASGSAGAKGPLAAANAACGTKPQPDCPLQSWMKKNTNPAIAANDLPALATALDQIVAYAPPGYTNWVSISKDGAKAAKAGDMTATKASCRTCHDQYKAKYKAELRGRKI